MSLSSLIVQREIASIREVEEALARQVLYGGDLVTNLLEVCRLDESALGAVVGDWYGLPPAPPGELPAPGAEAIRMLAPEVAAQRSISPLSIDASGLVLAVAEPLTKDAEQELTFALAVPIAQRVAPLIRIRQALARDYGLPMDRRLTRLLSKMKGESPRTSIETRVPVVAAPPRPPSSDAMESPKAPVRSRPPGTPSTLLREATQAPAKIKRRRGPIGGDVVQDELEDASARDQIFDLVFDFARQFFDYTSMFVVHGDIAEGRDGYGEGANREKVVRIGVPLDMPGILGSARTTKKAVRALPDMNALDGVLLADLGRPGGTELVAMPIVVRTRVVAILLGDAGAGGLDEGGLKQVQAIVASAVAAFERIIVRRKLAGTVPPEERAKKAANPNMEDAVQIVIAKVQKPSVPPAAEELAAPIRELMAEPASRGLAPPREPDVSENPPPANLLHVRRHSGPPIPREEPEAPSPATRVSGSAAPEARGRGAGSRKPAAPSFSFDDAAPVFSPGYGDDEVERRLLAEIEGREPAPPTQVTSAPTFDPPSSSSPRAVSPPPPAPEGMELPVFTRPRSATDPSPGVMFPPHDSIQDLDATPIAPPVANENDPTPRMPPVFADAEDAPAMVPAPVLSVDEKGVSSPPPSMDGPSSGPSSSRKKKGGPDSKRDKPMPASEQQVSVKAHRPPSSHEDVTRVLPSVIVDQEDEYDPLVVRVLESDDEDAESDLLRAGPKAMPALMGRFPGPITVARSLLEEGLLPRASECGPILRLVASQRRAALPFVLEHAGATNDDERIWATYLLGELAYPESVEAIVPRVFDEHPHVRRVARLALRSLSESHPGMVVERLAAIAKGREQPTVRRTRAVEALGDTREENAVPILASLVNDTAGAVANAARIALVLITKSDFGHDSRAWFEWWDENGERHRLEWLIDALMSDSSVLRASAGDELKAITKEYFGYYEDLPRREREKVQARYRQWWTEIGRVRFSGNRSPRSSS